MKAYDALFVVKTTEKGWATDAYHVCTILSVGPDAARKTARNRAATGFVLHGERHCSMRLVGVEPAGHYDAFVDKYVGQFIDEYQASVFG